MNLSPVELCWLCRLSEIQPVNHGCLVVGFWGFLGVFWWCLLCVMQLHHWEQWHFRCRAAAVVCFLKYFPCSMCLLSAQRKLMQYLLSWCLVTWEQSLLYKNSKQKLEPCSENVQFISSPVGWIAVEFFFNKVTYCCRFLKGKHRILLFFLRQFLCVLVVHSLCSGSRCRWCNGSFYIILACHSHEESIVGAGWDWCPL